MRRPAVAAAASKFLAVATTVACALAAPAIAHAEDRDRARDSVHDGDRDLSDEAILGEAAKQPWLRITSVMMRMTGFVQEGKGYQSKAGPVTGPGDERLTVFEPQIDIYAQQGDRFTHRLWIPLDIVTAASPNAIDRGPDIMSNASRQNEAGTVDWTVTYKHDAETDISIRNGVHVEEDFRSWHGGLAINKGWNDRQTVVSASMLTFIDWFDRFTIYGGRRGRTTRTSVTGSLGVTQILTPTTVVNASYGLTVQSGELGTTWNSVPFDVGFRGNEILPERRVRHALVGRFSQALPWDGALKGYYRLYTDDWSIRAHTVELQLLQRMTEWLYAGATYRYHTQDGASFFAQAHSVSSLIRTSDSDLATLDAHTVGGKVVADVPLREPGTGPKALHFEVAFDRYWRNPALDVGILTCATGFSF